MKIGNSSVSMTSNHEYESHVSARKATLEVNASRGMNVMRGVAAIYEGAGETSGTSMVSAMEQYQKQEQRLEEQQRREQEIVNARQALAGMRQSLRSTSDFGQIFTNVKSLLDEMIEALRERLGLGPLKLGDFKRGNVLDLRSPASMAADARAQLFSAGASDGISVGTTAGGTLWQRVTAASGTRSEHEQTTFQSQGFAVTEDGRSFSFDVSFSLSRSFTEKYESLTAESFIMTDPLIISLDSDAASVSDSKFEFDLDSDGKKETISFAGEGSGFLALDVNGNGVIDDGSELFGTKSGDGFADLAAYDEDGNHWIDENDSVYENLRVWTRDANGNDRLMSLKEANVGAIYLGSADTEFSLNDAATNETNAVIRRTGVYLRENGGAGTLSHVDLRC